jgi:exopolysaccharide biosynthesis polyprenyl glycosylphosphotransferase
MFLLWVVEFLLCFFSFYLLLLPANAGATAHFLADLPNPADAPPPLAAMIGLHEASAGHALLLSSAIGMASLAIGLYRPEICLQTRRLLLNTVVAGLLAFPVVLTASALTDIDPSFVFGPDAFWPIKILLTWILLLFLPRLGFRIILRLGLLNRNVVVVGSTLDARRIEAAIALQRRGFFRVIATVPPDALATLAESALRGRSAWAVVVASEGALEPVRAALRHTRLTIIGQTEFCERHLRRMDLAHLPADWLREARGPSCGRVEAAIRRAAEIAISLALLALTLPLLLLAALLIKIDSPGPALYRQERIGLGGRIFTLYKLRSMHIDAEASGPAWATPRDSRITRVGAFIRLTRIDELPQLINVLRGEMCFVGPRPERPPFVSQLAREIPHYRDRARVKPGITGWAQVNYPYGASVEDARQKLAYDLYYVKHRTLFLDAVIVLATIRVILFQEGAR